MKDALRLSAVVPSSPHTVYSAWLDSAQHSAFTGSKAVVNGVVGGNVSAWDGYITGKFVQLDLGRRIVQSWRTTEFPKGAPDSRLEVHFEPVFDGTRILVLHSDIPEGQGEKYRQGWNEHYFVPMKTYFGKMAIAADRASAARMAVLASQPRIVDEEEEAAKRAAAAKKIVVKVKVKTVQAFPAPKPQKPVKEKPVKLAAAKPVKAEKPAKPAKTVKPAKAPKPAKPVKKALKPAKKAPKPAKKAPKPAKKAPKPAKKAPKPAKKAPKPAKKAPKPAKKGKKKK